MNFKNDLSEYESEQKLRTERSEDVRDIVERIPKTFTFIITFGFLIFIVASFIIIGFTVNYPEVISGNATLSASQSSVKLVMPSNGRIVFYSVKSKDQIKENQLLAIVDNPAKISDILLLTSILAGESPFLTTSNQSLDSLLPEKLKLGELTIPYQQYRNLLKLYNNSIDKSLYQQQIKQTTDLTADQERSLKQLQHITQTLEESQAISENYKNRDSSLLKKNIISKADMERSTAQYLLSKRGVQEAESNELITLSSIASSNAKIEQLKLEEQNKQFEFKTQVINAYANLLTQVSTWEKNYKIVSPINGQLEFLQFWTPNQFISKDTEIFTIIPHANLIRLEVFVPSDGAGKVKIGQKAIFKLEDYPFKEYGSLEGVVVDISLTKLPTKEHNFTLIKVELQKGDITNFGLKLDLKYGMKGTVEIITENKKLVDRLFVCIKYLKRK